MSGNVNSVQNTGYSTAFSHWIQMHLPKVAENLQPHDIHALLHFGDPLVMGEWEAIFASLTPYERSRINTPASAWNRLKREREKVKGIRPLSTAAKKKASEEELQRLQDEIATRRDFAPGVGRRRGIPRLPAGGIAHQHRRHHRPAAEDDRGEDAPVRHRRADPHHAGGGRTSPATLGTLAILSTPMPTWRAQSRQRSTARHRGARLDPR